VNPGLQDLKLQAGIEDNPDQEGLDLFAELIIRECVEQCQREWYILNNDKLVENESPRDIGIRVGQKNGMLKAISKIKQHFGVV
jgi:hypothetical protein